LFGGCSANLFRTCTYIALTKKLQRNTKTITY
jgi:hypothetical protein